MSASSKLWPLRDDYQKAVLDPKRNLKDPRLHGMQVEMKKMGAFEVPFSRNGNFGAVYKFSNHRQAYALKVFADSQPEREQRYSMIARHFGSSPPASSLVSFSYDPNGIRIRSAWYPTLVMDWAEGDTLRIYLRNVFEQGGQASNGRLCLAWAQVMRELTERRMAHGDLQHGNILVMPDGSMKLVDYDGMFVPVMRQAGMTAIEFGMAAYQHPKRYRGYFDERLDDFGALVILLTLAGVNSARWQRCHKDDSYLLLKEADLLKPDQSALVSELINSPDAPVKKLAVMLKRATLGEVDAIPPFATIVADQTIRQLFDPTWRVSDGGQQVGFTPVVTTSGNLAAGANPLTPRQQEVLGLLVGGFSDEQIAQRLSIKPETVKGHISKMQEKTGVITRKDLIIWGMSHGIKAPSEPSTILPVQPVQSVARCPWCQDAMKPGDQFCRRCGRSITAPLQQWPVSTMQPEWAAVKRCGFCSTELIAGDQFCRTCGRSISGSLPNIGPPVQSQLSVPPAFQGAAPPAKKPSGKGQKIAMVVGILVITFWVLYFVLMGIALYTRTQR
ncbi:MAG: LuxR C-terminal-related transcriptional regulator [Blastocatellia bacterium]